MSRKYRLSGIILIAVLVVAATVIFLIWRTGRMQPEPAQQPRGMFEWNEETVYAPHDTMDLVRALSITRWYQEFPDDAVAMEKFAEYLHGNSVDVYALLGSVEWGFEADGASLTEALQTLVRYNESVSEQQRLDGVMVDVEPYTSSRFKREPEKYMSYYVDGMIQAYNAVQGSGLRIVLCIPRHYDDKGLTDELERLIANGCDEVAVMNYECGKEVEKIETEAMFAQQYGKELHCILEFQEVGKHGLTEEKTYRNKGLEAAHTAFATVSEAYAPQVVVWDYHWANPLRKMQEEMPKQ